MFLAFHLALLVYALMLFVPGYLVLRGIGADSPWALCLAPLPSIALYSIVGQAFAFAHVSVGALPVLLVVVALSVAILFAGRDANPLPFPSLPWWVLGIYLALGIVLGRHLFLSRLVTYDDVCQGYDLTQHLSLLRSFADAGRYSSLGVGYYLAPADQAIVPTPGGGFYPSGWHVVGALLMRLMGYEAPLVVNASVFLFIAVIYPLGCAAFLTYVFDDTPQTVAIGAVVCLSFVMFPWCYTFFGPLYPNLAGFALVPSTLTLFYLFIQDDLSLRERLAILAVGLLFIVGLALLHPNCLFTFALMAAPYVARRVGQVTAARWPRRRWLPALAMAAFTALACVAWYALYKLPFLQPIVWEEWPRSATHIQEIVNILTLSYEFGANFEYGAQLLLALLVLIGINCALHDRRWNWLVVVYGLTCLTCFGSAACDGELKHLLSGFWYTDHMRLGAMASMAAVPLATLGLAWVWRLVLRLVDWYHEKDERTTNVRKVTVAVCALFMVINFFPSFSLAGIFYQKIYNKAGKEEEVDPEVFKNAPEDQQRVMQRGVYSVHTAFGDYRAKIEEKLAVDNVLSDAELAFIRQVNETIPEDALVINNPMDGSFLAYGTYGTRVYYRNFLGYGGKNETSDSLMIRVALDDITTNPAVREAVDHIGAEYVLILSQNKSEKSYINLRGTYRPLIFVGLDQITDTTPGFEVVLSQDDMRLYRIL